MTARPVTRTNRETLAEQRFAEIERDVRGKTGLTQFCALGMHSRCTDVLNVCSCHCHRKSK